MSGIFDPNSLNWPSEVGYFWQQVANNNKKLAEVAEQLAQAAISKQSQEKFDELFARQKKLFDIANQLHESLEQSYSEQGLNLPPQG